MSANLIVGKDPTGNKVPVAVDASGKLQVGGVQLDNLNVNTDQIEAKQDATNAILTTTAADVATVKGYAQVTKGSGVVDANTQRVTLATDGPGVANLTTIASNTFPLSGVTQTSSGGKVGLDVNVISGGGGGAGASAAYNATLPTYTSGASTTLQTDVNGRLITTGGLTDTQLRASAVPVSASSLPLPTGAATSANQTTANASLANLDADLGNVADAAATSDTGSFSLISLTKRLLGKLTDGSQKAQIVNGANTLAVDSAGYLTANTPAAQTYTYTNSGAISANAVLIGPVDCSQFKEITLHSVALGTGGNGFTVQISNDSSNWLNVAVSSGGAGNNAANTFGTGAQSANFIICYPTYGAKFARVLNGTGAVTAGTTTCVAQFSQIPSTKTFVTATVSGAISIAASGAQSNGFTNLYTLVSAASTNASLIKSGTTAIGCVSLTNTSASFKYVKFFNLNTTPTVGTSTPVIQFGIPPSATIDVGMGFAGTRLSTGFALAVTGGSALLDNTAVGAGDVLVNLSYI